ncbi:MAG: Mth938-like domain-containing protein [Rickettsiales bacterium]|nr:Mth938-like domain-containing protein [Rickettsiales bacterium]
MDITPLLSETRQLIQSYGGGGFKIAQKEYVGPVIVLPDQTFSWQMAAAPSLCLEDLALIETYAAQIDLLIIGGGKSSLFVPPLLRDRLRKLHITIDAMDTGAAVRTFNVLLAEERRVAAALMAL